MIFVLTCPIESEDAPWDAAQACYVCTHCGTRTGGGTDWHEVKSGYDVPVGL